MSDLNAEGFQILLKKLAADRERSAGKYEELRLKLVKCFVWRGCSALHADNLADITIDRISRKLAEGVDIKDIDAYACKVSRYVWLEHLRKNKEVATDDDEIPVQSVEPFVPNSPDERLECLRKCLLEVTKDRSEREIIIGYYQTNPGEKQKEARKTLAEKFGLTMSNLKVKALRLRKRLEDCINECIANAENKKQKNA